MNLYYIIFSVHIFIKVEINTKNKTKQTRFSYELLCVMLKGNSSSWFNICLFWLVFSWYIFLHFFPSEVFFFIISFKVLKMFYIFLNGYFPFCSYYKKYWLYSWHCSIHPWAYLTYNIPLMFLSPALITCSLLPAFVSLFLFAIFTSLLHFFWFHIWVISYSTWLSFVFLLIVPLRKRR